MGDLWQSNVIDAGKLPLLLCLFAFIVTFVVTRIVVRMIRAGKGPFTDNSVGGVHVHHVVPGLLLMVLGGFTVLATRSTGWIEAGGVLFGMGLALVLDEFALVLHLEDVYWEQQGRLSVDIVFIVTAVMSLTIVVGSPLGLSAGPAEDSARIALVVILFVQIGLVVLTAMKGKVVTAIVGAFIFFVALAGAIRLARPHSPWARMRYGDSPGKLEKATARDATVETRWRSKVYWLQDFVAGVGSSDPDRKANDPNK